jgi:outer membrane cobalamin receptor
VAALLGACLVLPDAYAEDTSIPESPLNTVVIEATALAGPAVSPTGANQYSASAEDIAATPQGKTAPLTDVLAQMPGVAIDQNQQIHIRNTEGPQFQYQINGVLIPLDVNTNPPFLSMINPLFIKRLDLLDGVLPSRYSYATGGVVSIQTKDGCEQSSSGDVSLRAGQRDTLEPSLPRWAGQLRERRLPAQQHGLQFRHPGTHPDTRLHEAGSGVWLLFLSGHPGRHAEPARVRCAQQQSAAERRRAGSAV